MPSVPGPLLPTIRSPVLMSIDRPLSILNGIPDDEGVEDSAAFILDVRRAVEEALAILEADADRDSRAADNACNVQADVNANIEVNATQAVDVFISADAQLEYISATATFAVPPGVGDAPAALCDVAQTPANAPLRDPPVPLKTAGHPTGFAQVRGLGPAYAANVERCVG